MPTNILAGNASQFSLSYGSGSPSGDFLPQTSNVYSGVLVQNEVPNNDTIYENSLATLSPIGAAPGQTIVPVAYNNSTVESYVSEYPWPPNTTTSTVLNPTSPNSVTVVTAVEIGPGLSATEEFLTNVLKVDFAQQGTKAISNVAAITASFAGVQPSNIAVFNFAAGADGTTGNEFS